jgi:hypothetical protein
MTPIYAYKKVVHNEEDEGSRLSGSVLPKTRNLLRFTLAILILVLSNLCTWLVSKRVSTIDNTAGVFPPSLYGNLIQILK